MQVDLIATQSHYLKHLAPVFNALAPEERGRVLVSQGLSKIAHALGVEQGDNVDRKKGIALCAGWADAGGVIGRWSKVALMEHGIGQTYVDAPSAYAGGAARSGVDLFLCPNEYTVQANAWNQSTAKIALVGDPYLDELRKIEQTNTPFDFAFGFHWDCDVNPETQSTFGYWKPGVLAAALEFDVLGHAHPRIWKEAAHWYASNGITCASGFEHVVRYSKAFICDNSSAMYYAAALGKPVVVLNHPCYRRDVNHGIRFWKHSEIGVQVSRPEDLTEALWRTHDEPLEFIANAQRAVKDLFPFEDGKSAERCVNALRDLAN